jgi:hypothetical protein
LLADNSTAAMIREETIPLTMVLKNKLSPENISLDIFNSGSGNFSVILGLPWLQKHNPKINWYSGILDFPASSSCLATLVPVPVSSSCPASLVPVPVSRSCPAFLVPVPASSSCPATLVPVPVPSSCVTTASGLDSLKLADASSTSSKPCSDALKEMSWSVPYGNCSVVHNEHHTDAANYKTIPENVSDIANEIEEKSNRIGDSIPQSIPVEHHAYLDVFSKSQAELLPLERPYDCEILLKDESGVPPFKPLYNLSGPELNTLKEYIDEMLAKGFIRPSKSPCGAPIFFVKKKDGSLRPCVDYRELNEMTVKNRYPLPLISELLDRLGDAKVFTKIDLRGAYNLVRMKPSHEWKTAFRSRFGHFEYLVMPFGLTNAPAIFQAMMNDIFRQELDQFVVIYLDDILIYSQDITSHINHINTVLSKLRKFNLYAKLEKCEFHKPSIEFLGYIVSAQGLSMSPEKIQSILDWKAPTTVTAVQSYLGFCNFYRKFINNYSALAKPLTDLTKKSIPFKWTSATDEAFNNLKVAITAAPVLKHVDPSLPFILETDASDFALGSVLSQPDSHQQNAALHPVAFFSRKLNEAECNYTVHDKELLAIVASLRFWRHYLAGAKDILVYSDHKNLTFFRTRRILKQRHARWAELLSEFDFKLCYQPGSHNLIADALSRRHDLASKEGDGSNQHSKFESTLLPTSVWNMAIQEVKSLYQNEISDEAEKLKILQSRHDSLSAGHPGQHKTYDLVTRDFWWPGIRNYIKNYVKSCDVCQRNKASRHKPYGLLEPLPIPSLPWSSIGMDFIVKLPKSQGYDSILVFVCKRTKQAHFIPCNETIDAVGTAKLFLAHIYKIHGLPLTIISDRGPQFRSAFWKSLMTSLGIKLNMSSAYHPQTDGQTERVNQTLEQYLRCFVNYHQDNWTDLLPLAEFAYNNVPAAASQVSPFYANYGFNLRSDLLANEPISNNPTALTHLDKIKEANRFLETALKSAQENQKKYADKHRKQHNFAIGQKVWLLRRNLKTKRPCDKLDNLKLGPFLIIEQINPVAFKIDLPETMHIHPVFHVSMLEAYHTNDIPHRTVSPSQPIEIDGEDEYEVEHILDARYFGNSLKFLVKWKGYANHDNTWEPESNLTNCLDKLLYFKKCYPNKLKKEAKRRR